MSGYLVVGKTGNWELVIGCEIHAQIHTKSKLFSRSSTEFGVGPNENVSFFDVAMPGMLPVMNEYAVEQVVKTGIAINAKINKISQFDRKNYFYPDLPSGYQITQFYHPIVTDGILDISTKDIGDKKVRINRIHIEQDAGKMVHDQHPELSLIDLNRAGIGLMEIVSEPDISSPEEAGEFINKLRSILRTIETCDGDMEKGNLRCDANVSVRRVGDTKFGTRCEIKNLNSIRNIMNAIKSEAERQVEIIESGGAVKQETRLFNPDTSETVLMRSKEDAMDYRYFPDPDLLPLVISNEFIENIKRNLPELPDAKKARYMSEFGISDYDASILVLNSALSEFFESLIKAGHDSKIAVNWLNVEILGRLNQMGLEIENSPVSAFEVAALLDFIKDGSISGKIAKSVLDQMFESGKSAGEIIKENGYIQISDESSIISAIEGVLNANSDKVGEYRNGKDKLYGFFVGEVMKATKGQANPAILNKILKEKLSK